MILFITFPWNLVIGLLTYIVFEIAAFFLFRFLNSKFVSTEAIPALKGGKEAVSAKKHWIKSPITKGIIERICIFLALCLGFPQILIAFGAFKIGTRVKGEQVVSNDYYLIGNFISISLVLIIYWLWRDLFGIILS